MRLTESSGSQALATPRAMSQQTQQVAAKETLMNDARLLTVNEVATLLNVSRRTVQDYLANRAIPVVRFSARCLRIRRDDLDAFISNSRRAD